MEVPAANPSRAIERDCPERTSTIALWSVTVAYQSYRKFPEKTCICVVVLLPRHATQHKQTKIRTFPRYGCTKTRILMMRFADSKNLA